jgi:hydroxybutyrate-dimer hydrolase
MGRVAATLASTLCLLIGMTSLVAAEDGKRDDDRDDRSDRSIEKIEKHIIGKVLRSDYDGLSNDLLTAGLGATGLGLPTAPTPANTASPTPEELRRLAIYSNYRALVDTSKDNGYGTLYGPTVGAKGQAAERDGKVAGTEYLALLDDFDGGNSRTTVALQVPETFIPPMPAW